MNREEQALNGFFVVCEVFVVVVEKEGFGAVYECVARGEEDETNKQNAADGAVCHAWKGFTLEG